MSTGKIPENILKRSILKNIKTRRSEVLNGASFGEDCAVLGLKDSEVCVLSEESVFIDPVTGTVFADGIFNNIAAAGASPVGAEISLLLPPDTEEKFIKTVMKDTEALIASYNAEILGGHTEVTDAVNRPVMNVTAFGKADKADIIGFGGAKPGDGIVISKWIGLRGTYRIALEHEDKLKEKFPQSMILDALRFKKYITVVYEAAPAVKSGVSAMHDASRGGIFTALWELAEASHVGLTADLKKIPIRQETIEICNFFDLNPYNLDSAGAMVMTTKDPEKLIAELKAAGIEAALIGTITDSNDRVITNGDSVRFLEPFRSDEAAKVCTY